MCLGKINKLKNNSHVFNYLIYIILGLDLLIKNLLKGILNKPIYYNLNLV